MIDLHLEKKRYSNVYIPTIKNKKILQCIHKSENKIMKSIDYNVFDISTKLLKIKFF